MNRIIGQIDKERLFLRLRDITDHFISQAIRQILSFGTVFQLWITIRRKISFGGMPRIISSDINIKPILLRIVFGRLGQMPLACHKGRIPVPSKLSLLDLFMGVHGGVLGETCALAILLGLIYMVATKTISIAIPASYIGSMFIFYLISTGSLHGALVGILSGGLMFGAVFMATDYVTSPFTLKGKLIYGLCLGIVTFAIRQWGSYAEGVSFALLFMNLWVPFINDWTRQTPYGYVKPAKKAKEGAGK